MSLLKQSIVDVRGVVHLKSHVLVNIWKEESLGVMSIYGVSDFCFIRVCVC